MPDSLVDDLAVRVAALEQQVAQLRGGPVGCKTLPPTASATFESLVGVGEDLWDSDEEFDRFLEFVRRIRKG